MSRDFPEFLRVSRDFPCFPGISTALSLGGGECPPPHTQNVEVLVISVYTAYGPIHQICLSVWDNHYLNSR